MSGDKPGSGTETISKQRAEVRRPRQYKVILLNDDYTTMDFVVMILETVFRKPAPEAVEIMMLVHTQGQGLCGVYTKEIAESKVDQVHRLARENEYPLRCTMEEV